jgi:hypothetical protein
VTASEFAFLALGLILGIATGAAIVEVLRARPPGSREIRVTVAPNSIHARRATTLADDTFASSSPPPAAGGPGDRRWNDAGPPLLDDAPAGRRLDDRQADAAPHGDFGPPMRTAVRATSGGGLVAVPMGLEPDPLTEAFRATAAKVAVAATGGGSSSVAPAESRAEPGQGVLVGDARSGSQGDTPTAGAEATAATDAGRTAGTADRDPSSPSSGGSASGPCAEERRVADERCAVAKRAREGATGAAEALRVAQRTYDVHVGNAEAAAAAIDPRSVRTAKEAAQGRFRDARASATTRDDVEAAARTWLTEINEINHGTRDASMRIDRDRAAVTALAPVLERLAVEADAARISAERADEACMAAREAVAACDETIALEAAASAAALRQAPDTDRIAAAMPAPEDEFEPATPMGSRAGDDAVLFRILRGDREAMLGAVATLAGDDPDARRRWQTWLSGLAEALIARSIEASSFDFPLEHFFWGPLSQTQNRDIAAGLASLGHRFDGFGGWADERVPSQRDLSLAVGYAGLDPMRIRRWPTEAEMQELLAEVRVAADEYVVGAAGGLTLGEMVTLLGRRADALTELWNEWGTVRPVLLAAG